MATVTCCANRYTIHYTLYKQVKFADEIDDKSVDEVVMCSVYDASEKQKLERRFVIWINMAEIN